MKKLNKEKDLRALARRSFSYIVGRLSVSNLAAIDDVEPLGQGSLGQCAMCNFSSLKVIDGSTSSISHLTSDFLNA